MRIRALLIAACTVALLPIAESPPNVIRSVGAQEMCSADASWLASSPALDAEMPPSHKNGGTDCPFYRDAWQRFIYATRPADDGQPMFVSYATVQSLFGSAAAPTFAKQSAGILSLAPRAFKTPNETTPLQDGVQQAGPLRGLLIDQNGNPVYYAIHLDTNFESFIRNNNLNSKAALANISDSLSFDPANTASPGAAAMELKSAWQIVPDGSAQPEYISTRANVPVLRVVNGLLTTTDATRSVTVRLLALHVVFALKGHPELVWSTFEHIDAGGMRDNAPHLSDNPSRIGEPNPIVNARSYTLYLGGTRALEANVAPKNPQLVVNFDQATQTFHNGPTAFQTSVYRLFPGSKSDGTKPSDSAEDDQVIQINQSMATIFSGSANVADLRKHYQLVGAVWIDDPALNFKIHKKFDNASNQTTDDPNSILAGEGRLSSTAMESFTQSENFFPNCFSCHNTEAIRDDLTSKVIIPPKLLNVSHVLSKFLSGTISTPVPAAANSHSTIR